MSAPLSPRDQRASGQPQPKSPQHMRAPDLATRRVRGLVVQTIIAAFGLGLALVGLACPRVSRFPTELIACLIIPGILFFRSLGRVRELPVRIGSTLISVIGSWTLLSTLILALGVGLSDATAGLILALVYFTAAVTFIFLGTDRAMR